MLFNSFSFALFLPVVFAIYWLIPPRYRWLLLLAASYWFYMSWNPKYVVLILFTTAVSYAAGLCIEKQESRGRKKLILAAACAVSLGVLFFFKYFNFTARSISKLAAFLGMAMDPILLSFALPVGISFYTFQTLSYVIDVYRGDVPAERHFGRYAAYVSFFPQLVAGPIERTGDLLPQIKARHRFDYDQASYGLKLMAWGFFKKLCIADVISQYAGSVFHAPRQFQGFAFILAVFLFSVQIYCDFSGYSDIAAGTARLMGIELSTNFRSPYFSRSIREFWSRWHISLSTWFRDYVYIPLGGSRAGRLRTARNLLITFLVSGLWHGADWTFVIWGGLHGAAQVTENMIRPRREETDRGAARWLRVLAVFCFCSLAWIFFAANSVSDAFYIIMHIADGIGEPIRYLRQGFTSIGLSRIRLLGLLPSLLALTAFDYCSLKTDVIGVISKQTKTVRWGIYVLFMLWMLISIPTAAAAEFIYFQF